jgi:hypothetical protein
VIVWPKNSTDVNRIRLIAMRNSRWLRLLAYVTGSVHQEFLLRNAYLAAENRILRPTALPIPAHQPGASYAGGDRKASGTPSASGGCWCCQARHQSRHQASRGKVDLTGSTEECRSLRLIGRSRRHVNVWLGGHPISPGNPSISLKPSSRISSGVPATFQGIWL